MAERSYEANAGELRRFIDAFNRIDRVVRQRAGGRAKTGTFREALETAIGKGDPVMLRHQVDLRRLCELRNIITHEATSDHWSPLPSQRAIRTAERLAERLAGPSRVALAFCDRDSGGIPDGSVSGVLEQADLAEATVVVDERGCLIGALTLSRLLRWVGSYERPDTSMLASTVVEDAPGKAWKLVARNSTVDEIIDLLAYPDVEIVVITEHGRSGERPLGWFTVNDVPKLYQAL